MNILLYLALATPNTIPKVNLDKNQIAGIFGGILVLGGSVAVFFIILNAIQYIISQGDAAKIKKAKDGILYGIVGIVISASAFLVVQLVVGLF